MAILRLEELTWEDVDRLDQERTIVMLPISPIEEHGPHLPLGTDLFGAQAMALEALELLQERDPELSYVLLPAIPLGTTDMAAAFPGTLHLRGRTLYLLMCDVLESLARARFRHVVIANHHHDLTHVKAIRVAADTVMDRYPIHVVEPGSSHIHAAMPRPTPVVNGQPLDPSTDVHAGALETSFIAYCRPDLLRACYRDLPPVLVNVAQAVRARAQAGKAGYSGMVEMGARAGYIGSPARADVDYGGAHLREGARVLADAAVRLLAGEPEPPMNERMTMVLNDYVHLD